MKTTSSPSGKSSRIRRWAVPASLALTMAVLPAATSTAEASDRQYRSQDRYRDHDRDRYRDHVRDRRHHRSHRPHYARGHGHRNHGRYVSHHRSRHFQPVRVSYYQPHHSAVSFYLEAPFVVIHGPRIDAHVTYYPGDVPLYEPGYCPGEVHYHPYYEDHHSGFHGSVSIRIGH